MSSTRDRIEAAVKALLTEIESALYDHDLTENARKDLRWLHLGIEVAVSAFNQPTGPDPLTDGGPTRDDLEGVVRHDIG